MIIVDNLKFIAISMLLTVGLSACDKPGPAETAGKNIDQTVDSAGQSISAAGDKVGKTMSEQGHKAGVAISDAEITARVKTAIFTEPGLDTLRISVNTVNGVVTLSGTVDSMALNDSAKELAENVPEVRSVNNRLIIKLN